MDHHDLTLRVGKISVSTRNGNASWINVLHTCSSYKIRHLLWHRFSPICVDAISYFSWIETFQSINMFLRDWRRICSRLRLVLKSSVRFDEDVCIWYSRPSMNLNSPYNAAEPQPPANDGQHVSVPCHYDFHGPIFMGRIQGWIVVVCVFFIVFVWRDESLLSVSVRFMVFVWRDQSLLSVSVSFMVFVWRDQSLLSVSVRFMVFGGMNRCCLSVCVSWCLFGGINRCCLCVSHRFGGMNRCLSVCVSWCLKGWVVVVWLCVFHSLCLKGSIVVVWLCVFHGFCLDGYIFKPTCSSSHGIVSTQRQNTQGDLLGWTLLVLQIQSWRETCNYFISIPACGFVPSCSRHNWNTFEFEFEFRGQSASEAIFRARAYRHNVPVITWWIKRGGNRPPGDNYPETETTNALGWGRK